MGAPRVPVGLLEMKRKPRRVHERRALHRGAQRAAQPAQPLDIGGKRGRDRDECRVGLGDEIQKIDAFG